MCIRDRPDSGSNSFITLDTTLSDNQQLGLHPALVGLKNIYDQGILRILQSVGYPSQNKSHFASTDIYNLSGPSNASDIAISSTSSKPFFSISAIRCHLIP